MNALFVIGSMLAGAVLGAMVGAWSAVESPDLGIGVRFNVLVGVVLGGFTGCIVGAVLFA